VLYAIETVLVRLRVISVGELVPAAAAAATHASKHFFLPKAAVELSRAESRTLRVVNREEEDEAQDSV
jgi:hypothetical protein